MINIIRVGRERLKEAYEIVNKVDQGMNVPEKNEDFCILLLMKMKM